MYKKLRNLTLRRFLPYILICFIIGAVLIGLSSQGIILRLSGPESLSELNMDDSANGRYVQFDASEIIVACAELSRSTDDDTKLLKTYYLLPTNDGRYMIVIDKKGEHETILDKAMDQSYDYYLGDLESLTPLGNLSGTITQLENDMESYIVDCIEEYQLPGFEEGKSTSSLIYPYQIELQKVGIFSKTLSIILLCVGVVFLVVGLALLVPILAGTYQRKMLKTISSDMPLSDAEVLFNNSVQIENVWIGEYIWYQKGAHSYALKTSTLIWAYMMPEPLVVSKYKWPVALYDTAQDLYQICFIEKKSGQKFLSEISKIGYPLIDHYTPEYAQLFKSDIDAFIELAAQK